MANIPTPRSFNQILGDMVDAFLSRFGIRSLKVGSPVLSILESAAQSDLRSSQDTFQMLNSTSLDRAKGIALDRIGADEDLTRISESAATGTVMVSDSSFAKLSTKIYQGQPAPIVGSDKVNVVDASLFPSAGQVYLGRGTTNYEGPLSYTSRTNNGTYWTLNLSTNTQKFHNLGETVILAQGGNRTITAGEVVKTPQGNISDAIQFSTLYAATIPDGETSVDGVQVVAQKTGLIGNVSAGAVTSFANQPFTGATVTNSIPFSNGQAAEDDDTFRERIKEVRQSRAKGTALALTTSVTGITATDENKRVLSASVVVRQGEPTVLYIDDGTGYEETIEGVAIESIVDRAYGGEQYFQVAQSRPVAKAYLKTTVSSPFPLTDAALLSLTIGGVTKSHTFSAEDFRTISNATAYEVSASINANSDLHFSAATSDSGTKVRIFAKADTNEDIQLADGGDNDANDALLFPSGRVDTLRLYRNDRLLSKDGSIASVSSRAPSQWGAVASGDDLIVRIDGVQGPVNGTTNATEAITYRFVDQDFVDAGTGYSTVGRNSIAAWAAVFEAKIPGITAAESGGLLVLTSNAGTKARAKIEILGGALVTKHMFDVQTVTGKDRDYTLDRNTGQIQLVTPLSTDDRLSAGTAATRAFLESDALSATTLASDGHLWFAVDGATKLISTSLSASTALTDSIGSLKRWGARARVGTASASFANLQYGDTSILWDSAFNASMRGTWAVSKVDSSFLYFEVDRRSMAAARSEHVQVVLADGRILICGGRGFGGVALRSCEVYDPATGLLTSVAPMLFPRIAAAGVLLLSNNKVLVVGGKTETGTTSTAEVYDPTANTWTQVASAPQGGVNSCIGYLSGVSGGRAIVAGGRSDGAGVLSATYLFNPGTNTWTTSGSMGTTRKEAVGVVVNSTTFAVFGGVDSGNTVLNTAEYFVTNTWTPAANTMSAARRFAAATLISSGAQVLVTGGFTAASPSTTSTTSADLFDTATHLFTATGALGTARAQHAQALTSTGNVLVVSGFGVVTAALYNTGAGTFGSVTSPGFSAEARAQARLSLTGTQLVLTGGDSDSTAGGFVNAIAERYDETGNAWTAISNGVAQSSFTLNNSGLVFARTSSQIQKTTVPAGANYTASSFQTSLNSQLLGASAGLYRTSILRVGTDSFGDEGDISLVTADTEGLKLDIQPSAAIANTTSHLGSVESLGSGYGTPDFKVLEVLDSDSTTALDTFGLSARSNSQLVGLNEFWDSTVDTRIGNNRRFRSSVATAQALTGSAKAQQLVLRRGVDQEWLPRTRLYTASPFALGPAHDLTVVVDQDATSKRFTVPFWRRAMPTGSYGTTITLKDRDNSGTSLAAGFGLGYDWTDFAVYMAARVKTHPLDTSKSILWRYGRLGPDGNNARLRYSYPDLASQSLLVLADPFSDSFTDIRVTLPSDIEKTGYKLNTTTRFGVAANTGGALPLLTYCLGFSISGAVRTTRIDYLSRGTSQFSGTVTGATSGATATVVTDLLGSGSSGAGTLVLTGVTGTFQAGEVLNNVSAGGSPTAVGPQYQLVVLTTTLPPTLTSNGLAIGNGLFLKSGDVNFPSGLKTLTAVTTTTVSYLESGTNTTGISIGTLSYDSNDEATLAGATPTIVVGDIVHIDPTAGLDSNFRGVTLRIQTLGNQYFTGYVETTAASNSTVPSWEALTAPSSFHVFALLTASTTANAIVTSVNVLAAAAESVCPVTAKVLGTGTGIITLASFEEAAAPSTWFPLTDGVNYVKSQVNPGSLAADYQFVLKDAINSDLVSGSDWVNEDVRLVPLTSQSVIEWLNTDAITGLSTVAEAKAANHGTHLQLASLTAGSAGSVQVQGGSANSGAAAVAGSGVLVATNYSVVTVLKSDAESFMAGSWVKATNTASSPKSIFTSSHVLSTVTGTGQFTFSVGSVYTSSASAILAKSWLVQAHGDFVCYSLPVNSNSPGYSLSGLKEGDWVRLKSPASPTGAPVMSSLNLGIFRVVRVEDGEHQKSFWIQNPNYVEETGESDAAFYDYNSIMPGDKISINTTFWGSANQGVWTVKFVGGTSDSTQFGSAGTFVVDTSAGATQVVTVSPGALGTTNVKLIQVLEYQPSVMFKRILGINPNQANVDFVDIKFDTSAGYQLLSETAGTILTPLDKFGFSTDIAVGVDGYSHSTGLIGEANRVVYGDSRDPASYPGVVAAGANVNIQGPLVKRISVSLNLRIKGGSTDIKNRVKSTVAAVINKAGVGQSIAISDILKAAGKVSGVTAVSIRDPDFSTTNDLIPVQPFEKPLVLNLDQDVTVTFAAD